MHWCFELLPFTVNFIFGVLLIGHAIGLCVMESIQPNEFSTGYWAGAFLFLPACFSFVAILEHSSIAVICLDIFCLFVCMMGGIQMLIYIVEAMTSPVLWICVSSSVLLLAQVLVNVIRLRFVLEEDVKDLHLCSIVRPTRNLQPLRLPNYYELSTAHISPPTSLEHQEYFISSL